MSAWTDWLKNPGARRALICEATSWSGGAGGAEVVAYLSTHTLATEPTDTPANQVYSPRLAGDLTISRAMSEVFFGSSTVGWGSLDINNQDGALDDWINNAWDGRSLIIKMGDPSWPVSAFGMVFSGVSDRLEVVDDNKLRLYLRDRQAILDAPVTDALLDTGGSAGEPVPYAFGLLWNVSPVVIDAANLVYKLCGAPIQSIDAVLDKGVAVTATPDLLNGEFTLSQSPAGAITANLKGVLQDAAWISKPGQIMKYLVSVLGPLSSAGDIDADSFDDLDILAPYDLGLYVRERANLLDTLDQVAGSIGAWYGFNRSGVFEVGILSAPIGDPVVELDGVEELVGALGIDQTPPRWRVRLGYQVNWTVLGRNDLASSVSDVNADWFGVSHRTVVSEDASIKTIHLLAEDPERADTLIHSATDAQAEAGRRLVLWGQGRRVYRVTAQTAPLSVELGDVVKITDSRFGLSAGKLGRVVSIQENPLDGFMSLGVWA